MPLHRLELALSRVIVEPAERVDAHDRGDDEQDHRALAAVSLRAFGAPVEPDAGGEQDDRRGELDHSPSGHDAGHRLSPSAPRAAVMSVATMSSAMSPS